ncbi:MAG: recombinase family protein [Actinomycetota bacterium]
MDEREAEAIRSGVAELIDRATLASVAAGWNGAGLLTTQGSEWTHTTVRNALRRRSLVGQATNGGAVVRDATGAPVAAWPAVLDLPTFRRLQERLEQPARRDFGGATSLTARIARCGVCGGPLYMNRTPERTRLRCDKGCVYVSGDRLDTEVERRLLAEYGDEPLKALNSAPRWDTQLASERNELEASLAQLEEDRYFRRSFDYPGGDQRFAELHRTLVRRLSEVDSVSSGHMTAAATLSSESIGSAWRRADLLGRRALLEANAMVTVAAVTVRRWDPNRVTLTLKGASTGVTVRKDAAREGYIT